MSIKFFCDNCNKEKLPHELTNLAPITDKHLCPQCLAKLKAILDNFWGDKI